MVNYMKIPPSVFNHVVCRVCLFLNTVLSNHTVRVRSWLCAISFLYEFLSNKREEEEERKPGLITCCGDLGAVWGWSTT